MIYLIYVSYVGYVSLINIELNLGTHFGNSFFNFYIFKSLQHKPQAKELKSD